MKEAERARSNRREIVKAYSSGEVTRRDLIRWGLISAGGLLLPLNGFSPFATSAYAEIPTGAPPSPLFGIQPFTQPMPRFDVLPRNAVGTLNPVPTTEANTTQQPVPQELGGGLGPIEGRPPGSIWAHQLWEQYPPRVAVEMTTEGAKPNLVYNPGVPSSLNSGIDAATAFPPRFHPNLPDQHPDKAVDVHGHTESGSRSRWSACPASG